MSHTDLRTRIESYISNNWSDTDVEFENVPFDVSKHNEYISVYLREGQSEQFSLGTTGSYTTPGAIIISVFVKKDTGTARCRQIADAVSDMFRGLKLGSIVFYVPQGSPINSNTVFFQFNVTVPFYAFYDI